MRKRLDPLSKNLCPPSDIPFKHKPRHQARNIWNTLDCWKMINGENETHTPTYTQQELKALIFPVQCSLIHECKTIGVLEWGKMMTWHRWHWKSLCLLSTWELVERWQRSVFVSVSSSIRIQFERKSKRSSQMRIIDKQQYTWKKQQLETYHCLNKTDHQS